MTQDTFNTAQTIDMEINSLRFELGDYERCKEVLSKQGLELRTVGEAATSVKTKGRSLDCSKEFENMLEVIIKKYQSKIKKLEKEFNAL